MKISPTNASLKLIVIGVISLLLLIPASMITGIVREREYRQEEVVKEISSKWGSEQTIDGPYLSLNGRYEYSAENDNKDIQLFTKSKKITVLPSELNIESEIVPEIRYRGIFKSVLYTTKLKLSGKFSNVNDSLFNLNDEIISKSGELIIGITDLKGVKQQIRVDWNDMEFMAEPGISGFISSGVKAPITISEVRDYIFTIDLTLNGSERIYFTPIGKTTNVKAISNWIDPSFIGAFLPDNRALDQEGFSANWSVLHLNRNYPQVWDEVIFDTNESRFGVELLMPVDQYQKTTRTSKYAIMFIGLTFLAFFMLETMHKKRVHPVQYTLIGFGLVIFYSLLLSLSEHIGFGMAYWVAALAIILLIGFYTRSVMKSNKQSAIISGILAVLYVFLYVLLQLQDFALLLGSFGLFIGLAVVMFVSRNIDWYNMQGSGD